jgi:L-xylulokinase
VTEAGALGASIMAGVGAGIFPSYEAGVAAMVRLERRFEPDARQHRLYAAWFEGYRPLWPLMRECLRRLTALVTCEGVRSPAFDARMLPAIMMSAKPA